MLDLQLILLTWLGEAASESHAPLYWLLLRELLTVTIRKQGQKEPCAMKEMLPPPGMLPDGWANTS